MEVVICVKCGEHMDELDTLTIKANSKEYYYICDCGQKATKTVFFNRAGDMTQINIEY